MLKFKRNHPFSLSPHLGRIVARYGRTFRLEAADDPIIFPSASDGSSKIESSIGFWYTRNNSSTECVVVMIRRPAKQVLQQVDFIADKLAEQLARDRPLSAVYEFDGSAMVLKAC